jgi:Protein of unknown function (DUF2809)
MLIGLASRRFTEGGNFIHDYVGDAIWAAMIYAGMRFLKHSAPPSVTWGLAMSFCFLIEFSQFIQTDWLNSLRQTTLGGLILGFGFLWSDLVMYTIGITFGYILDKRFLKLKPIS